MRVRITFISGDGEDLVLDSVEEIHRIRGGISIKTFGNDHVQHYDVMNVEILDWEG